MVTSFQVALQVLQQAIAALAIWAEAADKVPFTLQSLQKNEHPAVTKARHILDWKEDTQVGILSLLFDSVNLSDQPKKETPELHYQPLKPIENKNKEYPDIPYPLDRNPNDEEQK